MRPTMSRITQAETHIPMIPPVWFVIVGDPGSQPCCSCWVHPARTMAAITPIGMIAHL